VAEAQQAVEEFLQLAAIEVIAVPAEARHAAIAAYARFGKSRHPAALNFGDCFAYACARQLRVPLLYKSDDFALTDIEAVL
jgi:ribonuclease VapC